MGDFEKKMKEFEAYKPDKPYQESPRNLRIFAVMRQYAEENQLPMRDTSDLSPMEQWLLIKIANMELAKENKQ